MTPFDLPPIAVDLAGWPPPLHTSETGSFAHNTFKRRIAPIVDEIVASNDFPPDVLASMQALHAEIASGTIQPLREDAPDSGLWAATLAPYLGRTWFDAPWYWAETFFYRRVLECTRYFQPGHPGFGRDPYAAQKAAEIRPDRAPRRTDETLAGMPATDPNKRFRLLCYASLWGNRVDLSYNVARHIAPAASLEEERAHLLVDDTQRVWQALAARPGRDIAVITDNAGAELLMDLALVDCLLDTGLAARVVLHVKSQPFFVSDAMIKDVLHSVEALPGGGSHAAGLARRLEAWLEQERLQLESHWFYSSCLMYYQVPDDLRQTLAGMDFVILKGDANYRRLLGDARWDPTTPFDRIVSYFPTPLMALRTLKAELIAGLAPGEAEHLFAIEPDWRVNGRRGIAQARWP